MVVILCAIIENVILCAYIEYSILCANIEIRFTNVPVLGLLCSILFREKRIDNKQYWIDTMDQTIKEQSNRIESLEGVKRDLEADRFGVYVTIHFFPKYDVSKSKFSLLAHHFFLSFFFLNLWAQPIIAETMLKNAKNESSIWSRKWSVLDKKKSSWSIGWQNSTLRFSFPIFFIVLERPH